MASYSDPEKIKATPSGVATHRLETTGIDDRRAMLKGGQQRWTQSGFRITIQPDSAIRIRIGLDFEKTQPDQIWISKLRWSLQ